MAAYQAPPSLGFSRQEHWSGLPFPSPMHESKKRKWSRSVVSDFCDPMDCSLLGSSVHGILQARVLEWGAIAFSEFMWLDTGKFKICGIGNLQVDPVKSWCCSSSPRQSETEIPISLVTPVSFLLRTSPDWRRPTHILNTWSAVGNVQYIHCTKAYILVI